MEMGMGLRLWAAGVLWLAGMAMAWAGGLQDLESFNAKVRTFEARFVQTVPAAQGQAARTESGRIWIARPGRFRWEYEGGSDQVILSDGKTLQLYDRPLAQVTRRPVDQALASTPALLLSGQGDLSAQFEVAEGPVHEGLNWVSLTPRNADTDFRSIRLGLSEGVVRRMELEDHFDQRTRIDFTQVQVNRPIDSAVFRLKLPPGIEVIEE
jgi:outer membrane lipoprotein carrier protein